MTIRFTAGGSTEPPVQTGPGRTGPGQTGPGQTGPGQTGQVVIAHVDPMAELDGAAGRMLLAEQLFEIAVDDLNAALGEIKAGRLGAAKAGRTAIRDLAEMGRQLLEERRNVDKLRKQVAGAVGARGELDLDAARDEIGRRLACLRDARGD